MKFKVIFRLILKTDAKGLWNCLQVIFTEPKSTLVQVMVWCRQATSYYLSQCQTTSLSPHGVTRPQWVKILAYDLVEKVYLCHHIDLSFDTSFLSQFDVAFYITLYILRLSFIKFIIWVMSTIMTYLLHPLRMYFSYSDWTDWFLGVCLNQQFLLNVEKEPFY